MISKPNPDEFLKKNNINIETWTKADIQWPALQEIAQDHQNSIDQLQSTATLIANQIQNTNEVHSVRWRIKDTEHLLEKIIRKRAEKNDKYNKITAENYFEIVTDLVGVRALHLFKEECFKIDLDIKKTWKLIESPVAYIREGDSQNFNTRFEKHGLKVSTHPAGYRSIHYVIESTPIKRKIFTEIQVRTIFEEGWSEIDHKVRYPNYSSNELIKCFLEIFNRMAGSADDMGGFVLQLTKDIKDYETAAKSYQAEKHTHQKKIERKLEQLGNSKSIDHNFSKNILDLKNEIQNLKQENLSLLLKTKDAAYSSLITSLHVPIGNYHRTINDAEEIQREFISSRIKIKDLLGEEKTKQ